MILLENGAEVLQMATRGNEGIVLAQWKHKKDELIVWRVHKNPFDDKHYCEHGYYIQNDPERAEQVFRKRAMTFMGWEVEQ